MASCPAPKVSTKETHRPLCCEPRGHHEHCLRWSSDVSEMPNFERPVPSCGSVKLAICSLMSRWLLAAGEAWHCNSAAAGLAGKLDHPPGRDIFAVFCSCARHSPCVQTAARHTSDRVVDRLLVVKCCAFASDQQRDKCVRLSRTGPEPCFCSDCQTGRHIYSGGWTV